MKAIYCREDDGPPEGTVIGGDGEPIPPGDTDPYPSGGWTTLREVCDKESSHTFHPKERGITLVKEFYPESIPEPDPEPSPTPGPDETSPEFW